MRPVQSLIAAVALVCMFGMTAMGQVCGPNGCGGDTGAASFAARLNQSRGLFHDRSYAGAEVVFRSSNTATPEAAHRAWANSPGHARLINAGLITDVQCVGGVCVGRGGGGGSSTSVSTTTTRTTSTNTTSCGRQPVRSLLRAVFRR